MNENLNFYKEFYFREIDRKNYLNNSINIPVLIITAIISIHFFLFSNELNTIILVIGIVLSVINLVSILFSIYFLSKSYSNFFRTHIYRELTDMISIREYEINLMNEQEIKANAKIIFEDYLIEELSISAKHNFLINKTRTEDLAKSKSTLFISIILTIIYSILFILTLI